MEDKLKEWLESEWDKCKASPSYLYHNYFLINGKKPVRTMTDEQFDELFRDYKAGKTITRFRGRGGRTCFMALKN